MWDYVDKRVKFVSHFNLWTKFKSIIYIRKEQKYVQFCSWYLKAASFGTCSHNFCPILKNKWLLQSFFKCAFRVVRITFSTKQRCKALKRGHGISGKEGPEATASLPFLLSIPELWIYFVGKAHVTKMKLDLNFSHSKFKFRRHVIVFSRSPWFVQIWLRAALSYLYTQLSVVYKFCNIVVTTVFTV